jgi:predicted DCC family thiol-disulfide oxidoreductase YuxK
MVSEPTPSGRERILIYDGQCRLCVTAKEGIERAGGEGLVRFVPYQSEEAACRLGRDYRPGRPDVAFLVEDNGTVYRGLDAFLPLLPGLRGGHALLALMRVPLFRPLALLAYRLVARYRYAWFGTVKP